MLSVPHAGRDYPACIFKALRLPHASLVRLEDRYADLLTRRVIALGYPVIIAHRARAWIDLNRDENDLDVEMVRGADRKGYPAPGAKQRGGLGLIPRRLSGDGDLWREQFSVDEVESRIVGFHRPYHSQVSAILADLRAKFGSAVLLDLHSMPPIRQSAILPPQFVVGDRFGKSAAARFSELLMEQIRARGYVASLNHPYAGEHILARHGKPNANIHAMQIEVDRSLYLDSHLREPGPGLDRIASFIANLVDIVADEAMGSATLIAAE
ncbi:MAG: N-formylglutamate amidohydrolase [Sphingomonadaceae bacterium]|nr:N-formylglutamate amidohydrolase [Sphingomonadaceae bacterium]